jgi:hypothetical protein
LGVVEPDVPVVETERVLCDGANRNCSGREGRGTVEKNKKGGREKGFLLLWSGEEGA